MSSRPPRTAFRPAVLALDPRDLPSSVFSVPVLPMATPAILVHKAETPADGWDRSRLANERARLTRGDYPRLGRDYEVVATSSDRYNCIAFSLGYRDRWISPRTGPRSDPFRWADKIYAKEGYQRLSTLDMTLQEGVQKVVLLGFSSRNGAVRAVEHATIQSPDGTWMSKLGHFALIRHPNPDAVAGPLYGKPIAVYTRAV